MLLQSNVLFWEAYDDARYEAVLTACALRDDVAALPAGHETELGERGINLSGMWLTLQGSVLPLGSWYCFWPALNCWAANYVVLCRLALPARRNQFCLKRAAELRPDPPVGFTPGQLHAHFLHAPAATDGPASSPYPSL